MDAVFATICNVGRAIHQKYRLQHIKIKYTVNLTTLIIPIVSTLSQPLQMASHALDWGDLFN